MSRARIMVFTAIFALAAALSLATTYFYGLLFSHPRYWDGTVARVNARQAAFIESSLAPFMKAGTFPNDPQQLEKMFAPLANALVIEFSDEGRVTWSNVNPRYKRGDVLKVLSIAEGKSLIVSKYLPPTWASTFLRWIRQPDRWLEPSLDHITVPFVWFLFLYTMFLTMMGVVVKARFLEKDVLPAIRKIESRLHE